jgi:hypothetical protein
MTLHTLVLFGHVVGMLGLFLALAAEWQALRLLRDVSASSAPGALALLRILPQLTGIAAGLIIISGLYLAQEVGVWTQAWVRLSLATMVVMAVVGGVALRPLRRRLGQPRTTALALARDLHQLASAALVQTSLQVRIATGLGVVYLMLAKPDLLASIAVIGVALVAGVATARPAGTALAADIQEQQWSSRQE